MIRPMTISEKILAEHAGLREVEPGQLINARVDLVLGNDITAPIAIEEMRRVGATKVFDPAKIVMVPDHFVPNKDIKSAQQCQLMREFAKELQPAPLLRSGRNGDRARPPPGAGAGSSGRPGRSGPTATPAPTGPSGPLPRAWAQRMSPRP